MARDRHPRARADHRVRGGVLPAPGITSVVWACGFRYAFDWIRIPLLDEIGEPTQRRGVTPFPGLYFVGLPWLYKLKSSFLR